MKSYAPADEDEKKEEGKGTETDPVIMEEEKK